MSEHQLLSTRVTALTGQGLVDALAKRGRRLTVANLNMHALALAEHDTRLVSFFQAADIVFIDGMPLVWYLRARGEPVTPQHRLTVLDWLPQFLERAATDGLRVFHLGGSTEAQEPSRRALVARHAGLHLTTYHGFFDDDEEILTIIDKATPDVLLVGMGMPRQELWLSEHRAQLAVPVVCTVGGAFSYFAGEQAMPPRWLGPLGLEGAYRLSRDPQRLWRRYLIEPWTLVGPALDDWRTHRERR